MAWRVEPLDTRRHDRSSFRSGVDSLDRYLATQAGQDARRHLCATYCLVEERAPDAVAGYYTLAAGAVRLTGLPDDLQRRLPRYPDVPVYLLGRLAVRVEHQGRGAGSLLLHDALLRVLQQEVPAWGVIVDAIDANATRFYMRHGFAPFPHQPQRLLLPTSAIHPARTDFKRFLMEGPDFEPLGLHRDDSPS